MTQKDRGEVREMIHDVLSGWQAGITAQNDVTNITLGEIRDHLKNLNGSIVEHAKQIEELRIKEAQHIVDCPAMPEIAKLKEEIIGSWLRKHWKLTLIVFFALLFVTNAVVDFLGIKGLLGFLTK